MPKQSVPSLFLTESNIMLLFYSQTWKDCRFAWDPSSYNNIREVRLPSYYFWKPDIADFTAWVIKNSKSLLPVWVRFIWKFCQQITECVDDHLMISEYWIETVMKREIRGIIKGINAIKTNTEALDIETLWGKGNYSRLKTENQNCKIYFFFYWKY